METTTMGYIGIIGYICKLRYVNNWGDVDSYPSCTWRTLYESISEIDYTLVKE